MKNARSVVTTIIYVLIFEGLRGRKKNIMVDTNKVTGVREKAGHPCKTDFYTGKKEDRSKAFSPIARQRLKLVFFKCVCIFR